MSAPAEKRMTTPEFLAWAQTQEKGRYELFRGEIIAMAPERAEHVRAKAGAWRALDAAIRRAGAPCEAFMDRRVGEEPITLKIVRDGAIRLDPPGVDLATSDIFA